MSKSPTDKQLCPLHSHTVYSVLDGASDIDEYIQWCKDNGAPGLAVTDHGWMIGALEVHQKAQKAGLVGIPGVEFYVAPDPSYKFKGKAYDYYHVTAWAVSEKGYRNLLKLGSLSFDQGEIQTVKAVKKDHQWMNVDGFHKRVVKKFAQVKPRITFDELLEYNEGLVIGSGCLIGAVNKALLQGEREGAEMNLLRLMEVFKGRMFMELMPHNCTHDWDREAKKFKPNECTDFSPDGDLQKACNLENIEIARRYKLPLILTVDSHFVRQDQKAVQDMLLQNGDADGWHFHNSYHMMTTQDAWNHWRDHYGESKEMTNVFVEAVENNHQVVEMAKDLKIKDPYHLPDIPIPEPILHESTGPKDAYKLMLLNAIEKHGRMKWDNPEWIERLDRELSVICDNGEQDFSKYFLFLERWASWARDHSILSAPGRGSGAGSLLCYLLKITHLDPFRYKLPFERFLSPGRIKRKKWPDIDWDMGNRGPLLAALAETYGDKFAQCSTHGKLKVKSAVKDAHRVLVIRPLENEAARVRDDEVRAQLYGELEAARTEVEEVTKTIKNTPMGVDDRDFLLGYTDQEGNIHEGHLDQNELLQNFFKKFSNLDPAKDMKTMVERMLGIPRSVGRHASAYFISDEPIWHSVPTCDVSGHVCTQYTTESDNNYAEKAGLIKFDFLGVNTLLDISNCIRMVQKSFGYKTWQERLTINGQEFIIWKGELPVDQLPGPNGEVLDVYELPDSPGVFADLTEGKTSSLFQISTPLLTGFCKRVKPDRVEDLSAIVALCRPGPLDAIIEDGKTTMTEAYIRRKHGEMAVTYVHPGMEPILKDTYGVAVYQEQLQQMFSDLAGYSAEEADYIRELVGKKKKQDMEKIIPEIRQRLKANGWTDEQSQVFINLCISSARYSFNRAHSASYGYVAYMSAYLKHHHPKEWWTAVLQNCKVEEIREKGYARSLRDMLVLPHVNGPTETFEARDDGKVHSPLWLIEGVGEAACKAIQRAKDAVAESSGLTDPDFKSIQDFYERIDKRAVNEGVFKKLIIAGAFDRIEPGKRPKELLREYLYLKKVQSLKSYGANKSGQELRDAVGRYLLDRGQAADVEESLSDFPDDNMSLEIKKTSILPIYRMDVHENFHEYLSKYIHYDGLESPVGTTVGTMGDGPMAPPAIVHSKTDTLADEYDIRRGGKYEVAWAGLLEEKSEFRYVDKKTQKQVSALKMKIVNDGEIVECILWPNFRELMKQRGIKEPSGSRMLICIGSPKPSKVPGQWSISINRLIEIS